jgi:DNA end-binding protein Ku
MAARSIWKGQLRLSLVSIPVEMYSATKPGARISFRQIHKPSGRPVRYQKSVEGIGPIDPDDILSGYEFSKDEYILIDPEEINALKLETKKTFELVQFVGACEIPPLYFDKPYYMVPSDKLAEDAYRVVRDALRETEQMGLGQITMRGREYLAAARPCGDGLLVETLRYADEVREADPLFTEIGEGESDPELLQVATTLIERKSAPFNAEAFKDHYSIALRELVEDKRKNRKTPRVSDEGRPPSADNVIDLMSALKKSLEKAGGGGNGRSPPKSNGSNKAKTKAKAKAKSKSKSKPKAKTKASTGSSGGARQRTG